MGAGGSRPGPHRSARGAGRRVRRATRSPAAGIAVRLAGTALLGTSAVGHPGARPARAGAGRVAACAARSMSAGPGRSSSSTAGSTRRRSSGPGRPASAASSRRGLAGKDLRDLHGSEARQRASLQPLAPFAVLDPRRHGPPADRRTRRRLVRGARGPRGRDRRRSADARLRPADARNPPPPAGPGSGSRPASWPGARVAGCARPVCAGSRPASTSSRPRSRSTTAAWSRCRSPTSSASSDGSRGLWSATLGACPLDARPRRRPRPTRARS